MTMKGQLDMAYLREVLAHAIKQKGLSPRNASLRAGLGETAIRDILLEKTADVRMATMARLADVLEVPMACFFERNWVAVIGEVGPTGMARGFSKSRVYRVNVPQVAETPLLAYRIATGELAPRFEEGDLVLVARDPEPPTDQHDQLFCIAHLRDGSVVLCRVAVDAAGGATPSGTAPSEAASRRIDRVAPILSIIPAAGIRVSE